MEFNGWMDAHSLPPIYRKCNKSVGFIYGSVQVKHFQWELWVGRRVRSFYLQPQSTDEGGVTAALVSDANSVTGAAHPTSLNKLFTERESESECRSFSLSLICWFHLRWDKLEVLQIGKPQEILRIWFTFSSAGLDGFSLSPARQTTRQPHTKSKGRDCYGKIKLFKIKRMSAGLGVDPRHQLGPAERNGPVGWGGVGGGFTNRNQGETQAKSAQSVNSDVRW